MRKGKSLRFSEDEQGTVWFDKRLCVPNNIELKKVLLKEAHEALYSIHPGATKMYQDIKKMYWWPSMKKEIAEYVAKCDTCQKVKAVHQRPVGLLVPLPIPEFPTPKYPSQGCWLQT